MVFPPPTVPTEMSGVSTTQQTTCFRTRPDRRNTGRFGRAQERQDNSRASSSYAIPGLLRSQISCVEGGRSTTMRELKVQIRNSGITSTKPAKRRTPG